MATEVWVRNPRLCVRQCAELNVTRLIWNRGPMIRRRIDPKRFWELHSAGSMLPYRIQVISATGTLEMDRETTIDRPRAIYPTWVFGRDAIDDLAAWAADPERPQPRYEHHIRLHDQEHRIVLTFIPDQSESIGRSVLNELATVQRDFPGCILHLHRAHTARAQFGAGFRSTDVDPVAPAHVGNVVLPNGRTIHLNDAVRYQQWVHLNGVRTGELTRFPARIAFNLKSALWAGENFHQLVKFKVSATNERIDPMEASPRLKESKSVFSTNATAQIGDKFACDFCSLERTCKYFRTGGVCAVPGSETKELVNLFKSRDTDRIIEGIVGVMAVNVERLEEGREQERATGRLSSEVTKIIDTLISSGVKLAKLRNPKLNGGINIGIGVGVNAGVLPDNASTTQLASAIYGELIAKGIDPDDIDAEMVAAHLESKARAIEVRGTSA